MNRANYVFTVRMVNRGVLRKFLVQVFVAGPLVCAEQTNFVRDGLTHKALQSLGLNVINNAGDHAALATDSADDDCFSSAARSAGPVAALVLMSVLGKPADERLAKLHLTYRAP